MAKKILATAAVAAILWPAAATAATGLSFGDSVQLSANGGASKTKLVRMTNERLVAVYGDYLNPEGNTVYDVKAQAERPARDIFARSCDTDCDQVANWSGPVNISGTASQSSIQTDWTGDSDNESTRTDFYGDSDKPNIFSSGSRIVVSWVDKYCDGESQRTVSYQTLENREIPFSCTYTVTSSDNGTTWSTPVRLSSGERDAKQDVHRGIGSGQWVITWQEDPRGLQLGEAEGPGDGASGAKVSLGTDIWYSYAVAGWGAQDQGIWSTPVRITDNYDSQTTASGEPGEFNVIKDGAGAIVADVQIESGKTGASRANLALQLGSLDGGVPQVISAYEETKGSSGNDTGKFIRYNTFDWNTPAQEAGCIISNPSSNARRARFVPQKEAGAESGLRLALLWREGEFNQGGPADTMLRMGIVSGDNGFTPAEMVPAVDAANCAVSDYNLASQLDNAPAINISSRTKDARATSDTDIASSTLSDDTSQNAEENAIAHRGLLRGDDLYLGYIYTPVLSELLITNTENYNFYVRHYDAAAGTWSAPENLSNISDTTINVREPRLVGTPGSAPNCDPITNPDQCQDKTRYYVAWGTQTNVSESSQDEATDLDLYAARAENKGGYYTPVVRFAGEAIDVEDFESQIRMTPAGTKMFVVWNESDATGTRALYREAVTIEIPDDGGDDGDSSTTDSNGGGPIFGCSYNPGAPFDPTLFLLTALAIGGLTVRRVKPRS
ncbi:hypothetical protein KFJ24_14840 [Marinobacter sediminum]|uniref:choice-of-anchor O protein n=1 Tax=Marinobacter sediminum TaxID=256323 RepID=UPI0020309527|nr:choice-of-anchor O protein [Marinobacter sediminum]MCM0613760.1 hypothetical protein [Marinobacter sediminum]